MINKYPVMFAEVYDLHFNFIADLPYATETRWCPDHYARLFEIIKNNVINE